MIITRLILRAYTQGKEGKGLEVPSLTDLASEELRELRGQVEQAIERTDYLGAIPGDNRERIERQAFERIPENLRGGLRRYLDAHIQPGHFLTAVLVNDLREAMGRADAVTRTGIFDVVSYLHNFAPSIAWGDAAAVKRWVTPTIPPMDLPNLGEALDTKMEADKFRCPTCHGLHYVQQTISEPHRVRLAEDGPTKTKHDVQFVWCGHRLVVVGIEGRVVVR
jgi:hypothetical protein